VVESATCEREDAVGYTVQPGSNLKIVIPESLTEIGPVRRPYQFE
jgi:hypothetical protein